jgi:5-hydroxyisourate hydrolase
MARISTHVLDTTHGRPAAALRVGLYIVRDGVRHAIHTAITTADGRPAEPLLTADHIEPGEYEIAFNVAEYFRGQGVALASPPFLDQVIVRFGVSDPLGHYHVPLLVSPYGYSTYRGS